jgi:nucleoside-diphosphate-sugar epimerase
MRVVVTGAAGFIGSSAAAVLARRGHDVVPVDTIGDDPCDVTDVESLGDRFRGADAVIHLAAVADFADCDADPFLAHHVNAGGTLAVLLAARASAVPRVVYASTFWAYDGATGSEVDEDTPLPLPRNVYTATKLAGELYCHAAPPDLEVVVCRLGTAYGPGARPTLMTSRMLTLAREGESLTVHGDGEQGRQMVYVEDLADGLVAALERGRPGAVYNLVGADVVTVNDVVSTVSRLLGEVSVVRLPARTGEVTMPTISAARAADELDWVPRTPLAEGLARQSADPTLSAV